MSLSRRGPSASSPALVLALVSLFAAACDGSATSSNTGGGGPGGTGGSEDGGSGGSGASGGGATGDCWQQGTMLDVSKAPGAGPNHAKPELTAKCEGDQFIVDSNGIPHYTFVQTTPNPLHEVPSHYEITRSPQVAAQTTALPLLGTAGFAVNGQPFFGPNEGAVPQDEAYGDPIYNGLMDACLGHTANQYHYHSMEVKCLDEASLVSEPWMNADPPADEASPVIGWALDGFPIHGPLECSDANCASIVEMKSSYVLVGDPKSNAWDAYEYQENQDPTFLDECNGHTGPKGDYHYHVTSGFPYILGCYRGTPGAGVGMEGGGGMGGAGGGGMGPQSCMTEADCQGACPPGSLGCTCSDSPMGQICVPTCTTAADCPDAPPGMTFECNMGVCVPG
jgi:YHYH protein